MKTLIAIISHNSKKYTDTVVKSLLPQHSDIVVIENSNIIDKKFMSDTVKILDLGDTNYGYGGCVEHVINQYADDYDFIGIFNNDIYNIPNDYCQKMISNLNKNIGILHSSIIDDGCPYKYMLHDSSINIKEAIHIENVCPFYSTKLLKEFKKYFPLHYYGWFDNQLSALSIYLGLQNFIVHTTHISHTRSSVRKSLETQTKNYSDYVNNSVKTYEEWIFKNKKLKEITESIIK